MTLPPLEIIDTIEAQRYGVEYQPIIDLSSNEVIAYECLARFYNKEKNAIRPDHFYAALHTSPLNLFQVEYQQKLLQLENAPNNQDIFVNLDQDSYFSTATKSEHNPFIKLFKQYRQANIVVELIENSEINDAIKSLEMINTLAKNNISTAIDDVCDPQSMISTAVIQLVDYIKLDKYIVKEKSNQSFMQLVNAIINYARDSKKKIILEGVETEADLNFAKQLNVDYVQGFYFKEQFINIR